MNERGEVPALYRGSAGTVYVGAVKIGTLLEWRIVSSPTTGKPTLIGTGSFARAWIGVSTVRAVVKQGQQRRLYGRPKPSHRPPITITGDVARLTGTGLTISNGTITNG